ncbi:NAD(P)/FAD-dependent oxidoreductase [Paracoccus laeviglucosivorans]|uniref:Predicted NAD/FAD-binding protein n=1 Tax=Paracoccus laeviglucosivorans TaxID=1197861 RepID=A0A521FCV1_9RHOB|nr:FAD-dependent oxidoreductase [Paracoccus laeviglucosivorans]SMO94013.1 Predicted NAD/FAD-binding protein [Paracoccus laeviglucosivorans]
MPFDLTRGAPQRIAIIGGGIAGLSAAWLLRNHHDVTLYEAAPRLGGHARTVVVGNQPVDTGFIVFNYANYPHLTAMFRDLDVPVQRSDMSFGVSLDGGRLEYALRSGNSLYGQRRNVISPGFHLMVRDILRFNDQAEATSAANPDLTIQELLDRLGLGQRFRDHYLFPICGAIWSTPASGIGAFPAQALIRFMRNHALMSAGGQHQWWTVEGGSITYVRKLEDALTRAGVKLRSGAPVRSVTRAKSGVTLRGDDFVGDAYDQVVFATHADVTLKMLADPSPQEHAALSAIRFQPNHAVLHSDPSVMPKRRRCWSSWVYRADTNTAGGAAVGVSYWMNRLQNIPESTPLFVSLNPEIQIRDDLIHDQTTFHHPVFDHGAIAAQTRIAAMQGENRSWFAGAWLRNGFHEDGFASAVRIARQLLPAQV